MMTREEAIASYEKLYAYMVEDDDVIELDYGEFMELNHYIRSALRPVSREQVEKVVNEQEPCEFCGEWIGGECRPREQDVGYTLYAGYTKQVSVDDFYEDETENLNFCPVCGRPLTDEAVQMVVERMEALKDE